VRDDVDSAGHRKTVSGPLRMLTFTTLYPNSVRPRHGIFVETRLREILRRTNADVQVVAPIPWFPSTLPVFGRFAKFAKVPPHETLQGIRVHHPRYAAVPGAGMYTAPFAIAAGAARTIHRLRRDAFRFDLIDAHYFYPDGVAAALLARQLDIPIVITARGSDVNLLATHRVPRRLIQWAARQADAIVAVSNELKERLEAIGVDTSRVHVLRNGVDCEVFHPVPVHEARASLGLPDRPLFAAVGNLVSDKGFDLAIDAIAQMPDAALVIVGEGPERNRLAARARDRDVAGRVIFLPERPQRELATVYSAADALVLASAREGWPNVLAEAMACGTPVVAADVGGVGEIVSDTVAGVIVASRTADAFAAAMRSVLVERRERAAVRRHAFGFDWAEIASRQALLYEDIAAQRVQ